MKTADLKYLPLKWLVHGLALLPLWVLYRLADLLYLILRYAVGYRRKTVMKNLAESFPDKTPREIRRIADGFYRNFADYIVETIKLLHISDRTMKRRMTFSGIEAIDETGVEFCQIYRPLRNAWFDALMLRIRGRFGAVSLPKKRSFLDLLRYRKQGIPTVTGFMSDQKPSHGDPVHVVRFLDHPTAMITGTETVCRRLDALPVYWEGSKPGRGRYHISVRPMPLTEPTDASPYPLTDLYASLLEDNIRRNPSLWLWSHKRWKIPVSYPTPTAAAE